MWLSIVPFVLVFSQFSSASVIHNQANADFRSHFDNHAKFGESIKQWFNNIKNRIFGRPALPKNRELFDLNRAELLQRVDDPKSFFLDLSRLSFDPDYDWGFHIGQWYFIRRGDRNVNYGGDNFNNWHFTPGESSEETEITIKNVTEEKTNDNPETSTSEPEIDAELTTLKPEVSESDTPGEETIQENDNETGSVSIYTQSAESVR